MARRRILLTGAFGLTGSHILRQLLSYNVVSVRAVVGSRDEAQALATQYPAHNGTLLEFAIVSPKNLHIRGAYDDALDSEHDPFDTVIHTVTPDLQADCLTKFLNLRVEYLISFLRSVRNVASNVRRVVITTSLSTFAQWLDFERHQHGAGSPLAARPASADGDDILATCRAGENIVNEQLWEWKRKRNVTFDLVSVTAPSVYGPLLRLPSNATDFEDANKRIWNIFSNDHSDEFAAAPYGIGCFIDVRDFASAHVQAAFAHAAANRCFIVSAGTMPPRPAIIELLRNIFPEFGARIQPSISYSNPMQSGHVPLDPIDTSLASTVLGLSNYRQFEVTLTDLARQIVDLYKRREWRRVIES